MDETTNKSSAPASAYSQHVNLQTAYLKATDGYQPRHDYDTIRSQAGYVPSAAISALYQLRAQVRTGRRSR